MPTKQRGYLAVELIIVLAVALIMMAMGGTYYLNYLDDQTALAASERQKQLNNAVTSYLKANYSNISTSIGNNTTTKYPISLLTLENAGYLPSGFSTSKNIFGQTWNVVVMAPSTSMLRSLIVTTGGETIAEKLLRKTAIKTGASGGYISANNPTLAVGTQSAWNATLSTYGLNPGAGHIASQITMTNPVQTSEFFYRSSVPGHAELNTMTTDINMGAKNIAGAATITGSTVNSTNSTVSNTLAAGTATVANGLTAGTVNARTISASGYLKAGTYTSGSACGVSGAIAQDSSGKILNCRSGTWASASAGGLTTTLTTLPSSLAFPTATRNSVIYSPVGSTVTTRLYADGIGYVSLTQDDYNKIAPYVIGKTGTGNSSYTSSFSCTSDMSSGSDETHVTSFNVSHPYTYKVTAMSLSSITYTLTSHVLQYNGSTKSIDQLIYYGCNGSSTFILRDRTAYVGGSSLGAFSISVDEYK